MNLTSTAVPLLWVLLGITACTQTPGSAVPRSTAEPRARALVTAEAVTDPDSPSAAGAVDWAKYDGDLQAAIDELAAERDCDGLQEQFTRALADDAAIRDASGSGTEDLMAYIDDRRQASDCS